MKSVYISKEQQNEVFDILSTDGLLEAKRLLFAMRKTESKIFGNSDAITETNVRDYMRLIDEQLKIDRNKFSEAMERMPGLACFAKTLWDSLDSFNFEEDEKENELTLSSIISDYESNHNCRVCERFHKNKHRLYKSKPKSKCRIS